MKNPFLFPEISGEQTSINYAREKALFIAYKDNESNVYNVNQKQGLENQGINSIKTNFRFDFGVINESKQIKQIFELQSNEYHGKSIMLNKDPVKKSIALERGWEYCEIYADLDSGKVDIPKAFLQIHDSLIVERDL